MVHDAAAKAVAVQDTANAWKAMAFKDIQCLLKAIVHQGKFLERVEFR